MTNTASQNREKDELLINHAGKLDVHIKNLHLQLLPNLKINPRELSTLAEKNIDIHTHTHLKVFTYTQGREVLFLSKIQKKKLDRFNGIKIPHFGTKMPLNEVKGQKITE